jgi:hypothetical protein
VDYRERLRDLSTRLVPLHRVLLDRERRAYENRHGSVPSGELLRLAFHDEQFAWLRALSTMIADIDTLVDADDPIQQGDAEKLFGEAHRLLKSGASGDFQVKYRVALQESPDVVIAHADVSRVLPSPGLGTRLS